MHALIELIKLIAAGTVAIAFCVIWNAARYFTGEHGRGDAVDMRGWRRKDHHHH